MFLTGRIYIFQSNKSTIMLKESVAVSSANPMPARSSEIALWKTILEKVGTSHIGSFYLSSIRPTGDLSTERY